MSGLVPPPGLRPSDEGLHPAPSDFAHALWGDSVWLNVLDLNSGVLGVCHVFITNRGFGRYQAHFWIDGVQQTYARKAFAQVDPGASGWSDGQLGYEVIDPFNTVRLTMDHTKFGFDLEFRGRFPAFDYEDCIGGSPQSGMSAAAAHTGGHYEQSMHCRGTFESRGGPRAGETRELDCFTHRDHSWTNRFASETPWEYGREDIRLHYWLALAFPDRALNALGFFSPGSTSGGFESRGKESRPIRSVRLAESAPMDIRQPAPDRYLIAMTSGDEQHVRVAQTHAVAKLQMLGEDDAESRIDNWEALVSVEIEETGERGYGVIEHSALPPRPRWLT
jgi:hypothetical protein